MGILLLIAGVALWTGAHFFKRLAPQARASMGDRGKLLVTAAIVLSLVLMVLGYRMADYIHIWAPPSFFTGINNLLMIAAVVLFGMSATTGRLRGRLRHPMLTGVKVWAVAHLLVNGDLASVLLFGGLLGWAVTSVILINRAEPWERPEPGEAKGDVKLAIISIVVFVVIAGIHAVVGPSPFG